MFNEYGTACDFERTSAYTYTTEAEENSNKFRPR